MEIDAGSGNTNKIVDDDLAKSANSVKSDHLAKSTNSGQLSDLIIRVNSGRFSASEIMANLPDNSKHGQSNQTEIWMVILNSF